MNINYSILNEILSFSIFLYFSIKIIFPNIIKQFNKIIILDYKKYIYIKLQKKINNIFLKKILFLENNLEKNFFLFFNKVKKKFLNEKNFFINYIINEKKFLLKNIILNINNNNNNFINKTFLKIKILFFLCFRNLYNELINYNNEFIINYE